MENFSIKCEAWQLPLKLYNINLMFLNKQLDKTIDSALKRNLVLDNLLETITEITSGMTKEEQKKELNDIQMQKDYQELEDYNNNLKN